MRPELLTKTEALILGLRFLHYSSELTQDAVCCNKDRVDIHLGRAQGKPDSLRPAGMRPLACILAS